MLFVIIFLFFSLLVTKSMGNGPDTTKLQICGDSEDLHTQFVELFGDSSDTDTEAAGMIGVYLSDLTEIAEACPRNEFFHNLNPNHMKAIAILKSIFAGTKSTSEFLRLAKVLRDRQEIHPKVWYHALASHSYGNPNLQRIRKFSPLEVMPDTFMNSDTLKNARNFETGRKDLNGSLPGKACYVVDETVGADNGVENELWYFREDIMLNSHHWFYHIVYPFRFEPKDRPDRTGELFYYIHQSLLARYNTERLSLGFEKTLPLYPLKGGTIEEGYASHLTDDISGKDWTPRSPNSIYSDVKYPGREVIVDVMLTKPRQRIMEAIHNGFLREVDGRPISIWPTDGIDILTEVIQSTNNSINFIEYSGRADSLGLHNNGHTVLGRISDPKYELQLPPGVMFDTATSMRDTIFYRWHTFVDDLFNSYKQTLPPYQSREGDHPLLWPGVHIRDLYVVSDHKEDRQRNKLRTFWRKRKFSLGRGLDFERPQGSVPVKICAKHLDHDEFKYKFVVERKTNVEASSATIRIFLAPRYDLSGIRFSLKEQRRYFFVLDTFKTQLTVGLNTITRQSTQSSLTIPWNQSLTETNLGENRTEVPSSHTPFCGCGFPHHLLLPKSRPSGLIFDVFVMVTNGEEDSVEKESPRETCQPAYLHCGLVNQKYPDAKPMGYPFDRVPYTRIITDSGVTKSIQTLDDYVADISNMAVVQVLIFEDVQP